ncbi:ATP-dependent DNA ligase [Wenyingzhuangia sp. IMCC45533]
MKEFSQLISTIEITNKTNAKIEALVQYFNTASDKDKLWMVALFTGKRPPRPVKTSLMKIWCMEITRLPEWLFLESYAAVGDLGEVIALLLPEPTELVEKPLHEWMSELIALKSKTEEEKKAYVLRAWKGLNVQDRLIFNKLIGGSFRIGVSKKTLVNALVKLTGIDDSKLMHSIIGQWNVNEITFEELLQGNHINYDNSKPYPFCLAYALEKELDDLGNISDWQVEYKWDGIRGQIIKRNNEVYIWSRGEELVTNQFPELTEALATWKGDFVIDGEILAIKDNDVLFFNDLQKRLNRKTVSKKLLEEVPVGFYAYDMMEFEGEDIRQQSLSLRRQKLVSVFKNNKAQHIKLSELVEVDQWSLLNQIRDNSRELKAEGLMLKHKNSEYYTGRKKGDWWKWKVDPLTIDVVMIYAQKGSGRRSSKYTDYTFAVKKEDGSLVTVAKAYSGLTDVEITEVSRWVNKNAIEKFGPVRTVTPELVFEIAFEGIALSNRHKSGVALRFPRIKRWRKDKTVKDIDTIESVKALIN